MRTKLEYSISEGQWNKPTLCKKKLPIIVSLRIFFFFFSHSHIYYFSTRRAPVLFTTLKRALRRLLKYVPCPGHVDHCVYTMCIVVVFGFDIYIYIDEETGGVFQVSLSRDRVSRTTTNLASRLY